MAKLQSTFEEQVLEVVEAKQSVGAKRKRGESTGPNLIGNLHDVEESKEEANEEGLLHETNDGTQAKQIRRSPRNKRPSPVNRHKSRSPS